MKKVDSKWKQNRRRAGKSAEELAFLPSMDSMGEDFVWTLFEKSFYFELQIASTLLVLLFDFSKSMDLIIGC